MTEEYIKLPQSFEGRGEMRGYLFEQVKETDWAYVYRAYWEKDGETGEHWEVFEKRISSGGSYTFGDSKIRFEAKEIYPRSKNFGVWAWCCLSERGVQRYLDLLKDRYDERIKKAIKEEEEDFIKEG